MNAEKVAFIPCLRQAPENAEMREANAYRPKHALPAGAGLSRALAASKGRLSMNEVAPAPTDGSAKIVAHIDGFEGCYLVGWAYSPDTAHSCIITVTDESGCEIARGEASRDRADLAAVGIGRTDFAFRIPVANLGRTSPLHVYADGVQLKSSPLAVGHGHFDGRLYVHDGFATGWTTERLEGFSPPHIEI